MREMIIKPKIGVMGSANDTLSDADKSRLESIADELGRVIAESDCVLITGATTGLPDMVSRSARKRGGLTIGVSPAANHREHTERYRLPIDGAEVIIYTGFGLKGRNVINIRASDVVIIFGGGMGTLNEFTIAYDEGKVIGVLEGSGGVANHIREIVDYARKNTSSKLIYHASPAELIAACLAAFRE